MYNITYMSARSYYQHNNTVYMYNITYMHVCNINTTKQYLYVGLKHLHVCNVLPTYDFQSQHSGVPIIEFKLVGGSTIVQYLRDDAVSGIEHRNDLCWHLG